LGGTLMLFPPPGRADEAYNLDAQSLPGYTGHISAPSAKTLSQHQSSIGLHRFLLGLAYGWPRDTEFGVMFELREVTPVTPFTRDTYRARAPYFSFHAKHRFLREERHHVDAAVGVWRHTYYAVFSPGTWFGRYRLEGGPSLRRRTDDTHQIGSFVAFSRTTTFQRLFVDYDSQTELAGLGWRYLLSDAIRLDLLLTGLGRHEDFFDRFIFGLSIAR